MLCEGELLYVRSVFLQPFDEKSHSFTAPFVCSIVLYTYSLISRFDDQIEVLSHLST